MTAVFVLNVELREKRKNAVVCYVVVYVPVRGSTIKVIASFVEIPRIVKGNVVVMRRVEAILVGGSTVCTVGVNSTAVAHNVHKIVKTVVCDLDVEETEVATADDLIERGLYTGKAVTERERAPRRVNDGVANDTKVRGVADQNTCNRLIKRTDRVDVVVLNETVLHVVRVRAAKLDCRSAQVGEGVGIDNEVLIMNFKEVTPSFP